MDYVHRERPGTLLSTSLECARRLPRVFQGAAAPDVPRIIAHQTKDIVHIICIDGRRVFQNPGGVGLRDKSSTRSKAVADLLPDPE